MPHFSNRLGIGSLMGCAFASALILALMLAKQSGEQIRQVDDWAGNTCGSWLLLSPWRSRPAFAWRSRFFSGWNLAGVVFVTVNNPAVCFPSIWSWRPRERKQYLVLVRWPGPHLDGASSIQGQRSQPDQIRRLDRPAVDDQGREGDSLSRPARPKLPVSHFLTDAKWAPSATPRTNLVFGHRW